MNELHGAARTPPEATESAFGVFRIFLLLGLTSFGGPIAHLGYFREAFVVRRRWLDERAYADLVALCQFTPGPASSKVGIGIGLARGGLPGALAAWLGFTLPSAVALVLFAFGVERYSDALGAGWLSGLKLVAVAVVAQAVWGMARNLCPDAARFTLAVAAVFVTVLLPGVVGQLAAIAAGAVVGVLWFGSPADRQEQPVAITLGKGAGVTCLALYFLLLAALPLASALYPEQSLALFDAFYRSGALVFGGGHVVLPLLQAEVVPSGWVTNDAFLAGYGAAQAVPGPLFTFAAYLGTIAGPEPHGVAGALLCLVAIFLPGFLLTLGMLPFWEHLRREVVVRAALSGINAAVVGLLLSALYDPVWTSAVRSPMDFAVALSAFAALVVWRLPPWLVVLAGAFAGWGVAAVF